MNDSCTRVATSVVIGTAERSLSFDLLMPASASLCACMADLVWQVLILMDNIPNLLASLMVPLSVIDDSRRTLLATGILSLP